MSYARKSACLVPGPVLSLPEPKGLGFWLDPGCEYMLILSDGAVARDLYSGGSDEYCDARPAPAPALVGAALF